MARWTEEDLKRLRSKRLDKKLSGQKNVNKKVQGNEKPLNLIRANPFVEFDFNYFSSLGHDVRLSEKEEGVFWVIEGEKYQKRNEPIKSPSIKARKVLKYKLRVTPMGTVRSTTMMNKKIAKKHLDELSKQEKSLKRYHLYKQAIKEAAKIVELKDLPSEIERIVFYIPHAKSKTKRFIEKTLHKLHIQQKPDLDNLTKGLWDALETNDHHIGKVELEKRWCKYGFGWIEIILKE